MVTLLLIISHFIGDFVLQTSKAATEKQQYFSKLLIHCFLYVFMVCMVLFLSINIKISFFPIIIIGLSHFIIDYCRVFLDKNIAARGQMFLYFIDQSLHLGVIFIVSYLFNLEMHVDGLLQFLCNLLDQSRVMNGIIYMLIYLIILQPAAVTVKKMLTYISNEEANATEDQTSYNAGYLIGILERIIVTTLVLQNQISTIGFVLAAKSLARFSQLNDKEFAEKYLVGSLTSIAISILSTLVLKSMLS